MTPLQKVRLRAVLLGAALPLAATAARASVVFTGYADMDYNAWNGTAISGNPLSLEKLGNPATGISRGFDTPSLGLFAATEIDDGLQFLMDVTYHGIGYDVGQIEIQYAYLDWEPDPSDTLKFGRVLLPFGYYNENYFYPFQRYAINSPAFMSSVFGLPMADWGAVAQRTFELAPFKAELTAYTVNGYGNVPDEADELRLPALPGSATSIVADQGSSANNAQPAWGGRLRLMDIAGTPLEAGFSEYYHEWNAGGDEPLNMMDAHLRWQSGGLNLLAEAQEIDVRGDEGFAPAIGSPDWRTRGWFATGSDQVATWGAVPVVLWLQGEQYQTVAIGGASVGQEQLDSLSGGVDFDLTQTVRLKTQYRTFYYRLPMTEYGDTVREISDGVSMAVVITF